MGASIIEKHITLDQQNGSYSQKLHLILRILKNGSENQLIEKYLGSGEKPTSKEKNIKLVEEDWYMLTILILKKIKSKDIEIKRPMIGLRPEDKKKILGKNF